MNVRWSKEKGIGKKKLCRKDGKKNEERLREYKEVDSVRASANFQVSEKLCLSKKNSREEKIGSIT